MFSTAFDSSQPAREETNVKLLLVAPVVAANDSMGALRERGGSTSGAYRVPSRPIPPTPMSEPMAVLGQQDRDDDEVSYDDGTHLTLASEAGSQDTSDDDRCLNLSIFHS